MHGWRCSRFCALQIPAYRASREREPLNAVRDQLEMFGLEGARSRARAASSSPRERTRLIRRVETTHEILSALPAGGELSFLHSGLCQTCLPHSRPADSSAPWERRSGRFSLTVLPGGLDRGRGFEYVGIPYGPKARLILIYLQTEGIKSRTVKPRRFLQCVPTQSRASSDRRASWNDQRCAGAITAHLSVSVYHAVE
jgi:hypothetical protein